jgi:three-Cys-motif partner protein
MKLSGDSSGQDGRQEFLGDRIGSWSETKLKMLREYAEQYTKILKNFRFEYYYIDAFAGAGLHESKTSRAIVQGSPLVALGLKYPFKHYYFIDVDNAKADFLKKQVGDRKDVSILTGDSNRILIDEVFPQIQWCDYKRALCFLDPYKLQLDWSVLEEAGKMGSVEIILNFPIMDMNRNALWRKHPEDLTEAAAARMTAFWGNEGWRDVAFDRTGNLFGYLEKVPEGNAKIAKAFRERLIKAANFKHVPNPVAMRNSQNAILYYIFFATQNSTGDKIARAVFRELR